MEIIENCLIVAAGKGTRLKAAGDIKPLVDLCGAPLIEHAMASAAAAGVRRFVVVTGYQAPILEQAIDRIRTRRGWRISTVFNPRFDESNGLSVICGEALLAAEPFYLAMCDHVVEPEIYRALLRAEPPPEAVALGVDFRLSNPDVDLDDVTRVRIDNGEIKAIGKSLTDYQAYDVGVFRAACALFDAIRVSAAGGDSSISGGMNRLAAAGRALSVDINIARWIDVDSEAMLARARAWVKNRPAWQYDSVQKKGASPLFAPQRT